MRLRVLLPKYVERVPSGGKVFHYYRRERGKVRIRLPGEPHHPSFQEAYAKAHADYQASKPASQPSGDIIPSTCLKALIIDYRSSPEWRGHKENTRKDYTKGLSFLEKHFAQMDVKAIERKHVRAIRDIAASRQVTVLDEHGNEVTETIDIPSRANKVVTVLSILLTRSVEIGWRKDNPALRFPKLKTTGEGYRAWTDDEVARFLAFVEDKPFWRLAFKLALYTGQRGQDQVEILWEHYSGSRIVVKQIKTGTPVSVPVHPKLKLELDGAERHGDYILMRTFNRARSETGRKKGDWEPWETNAFQSAASDITDEAGLEGVVWHGLRATATTRLAEAGVPDQSIAAITGHKTTQMVAHYSRNARKNVLADEAMDRLVGSESENGTV